MPPNTNSRPVRPFAVVIQVTQTINYLVDARTSEEAESIAEEWLNDGESGTISETEIHEIDAFPAEDDSLDAPINRPKFSALRDQFILTADEE